MCRSVWAVIAGATDVACKELRRAVGPEVQVVAMAADVNEALASLAASPADVIIIDASMPNASVLAESAEIAVAWFGVDPPPRAHAWTDRLDELESVITRALIARTQQR